MCRHAAANLDNDQGIPSPMNLLSLINFPQRVEWLLPALRPTVKYLSGLMIHLADQELPIVVGRALSALERLNRLGRPIYKPPFA